MDTLYRRGCSGLRVFRFSLPVDVIHRTWSIVHYSAMEWTRRNYDRFYPAEINAGPPFDVNSTSPVCLCLVQSNVHMKPERRL